MTGITIKLDEEENTLVESVKFVEDAITNKEDAIKHILREYLDSCPDHVQDAYNAKSTAN